MCGILGALERDPSAMEVLRPRLDAGLETLRLRGPDERGKFVDGSIALGHTRLAILDLTPAGAQPMHLGDLSVVFNGEIYNHHVLRAELEAEGSQFRSRSDTEVILHGYRVWGDGVVDRLDGMFAIGLWDATRQQLLLARDRVGKKPLYYVETPTGVRFASTVRTLSVLGATPALDTTALPFLLAYGYVPSPRTLYDRVLELEPGSLAVYGPTGVVTARRYWSCSFGREPYRGSYADAMAKVRALTIAAVERRLESDVPLGAFLSGGVDSTIIVGIISRILGRKVRTFSIGFDGDARFDETAYARLAAKALGSEHTEFRVQPSAFDLVERLVEQHDGPFGDSSAIPTSIVSCLARKHVTVALTGDGGDELFCGYERFLAAEAAQQIPFGARVIASKVADAIPVPGSERSLAAKARRFLGSARLPLADRLARWSSYFFDPRDILHRDLVTSLGDEVDAPLWWHRDVVASTRAERTLPRILEHNFRTYLPYDLLRKADRASMMHSLELRSPFLDTALIELASQLPPGYLRRGLFTKRVLKDAFVDVLPDEIRTRSKMGFGMPLGAWFRGDLRTYLYERLAPGARIDEYLDRPALDRLLAEHDARVVDHGHKLWLLLTFEVWLRSRAA